jgi:TPR repeat protein
MLKLKDEGNKLFGRQDYSKALEAYEKALKQANPEAKEDIAQLHSNKAACYIMIKR